MKLINEKYRALKPTLEYLTDEVVIAQAWKKTHGYIRSFNWYADTLALDISALTIEENAKVWAKALEDGKPINAIELVPAAKSESWEVGDKGWTCNSDRKDKDGKTKLPIRPLAHLTIRDQTWATAAMMCLADAVETAQGQCELPFEQARYKKVYSYGNRLLCDWNDKGKAWFRWGNSETYRKFFTDYQSFLNRPLELGREVENLSSGNEDVYIVNLDLSKFYNTIDTFVLLERLQKLASNYGHATVPEFWDSLKNIFAWKWRDEDLVTAKKLQLDDDAIKLGLPQGLVSAGFFANAYLYKFDKEVGSFIGKDIGTNSSITIHDYCRYVDDLRLVVSADNLSLAKITDVVNRFVEQKLLAFGGTELSINSSKTKVTLLSDLDNKGSMSNRIQLLQSELSGPTDRDSIDSITGVLENLLTIETESINLDKEGIQDASLLAIANFDHDIRPDTLKRFAANRIESIVRSKRKMVFAGDDAELQSSESENELLAKKLILAWMKDPSLGLVLRKAIEVYPDADLFEPVFDAIYKRSSFGDSANKADKTTSAMMDYLLADLFRCASDFNGYFQVIQYPDQIEPFSVIELLVRYAQKIIANSNDSDFVLRQALMLLAVVNKPILTSFASESLHMQIALHKILANTPPSYQSQRSALFEVAGQITGHFDTYASLFVENIKDLKDKKVEALSVFAKRGGPFWLAIWKQLKKQKLIELIKQLKWAEPAASSLPKPRKQSLAKVITSELNGFKYEHSALKLALGLLNEVRLKKQLIGVSPSSIEVKVDGLKSWDKVWKHYLKEVNCTYKASLVGKDPRFKIPDWIDSESDPEKGVLYWIGCILRASVLGGADYTGTQWKPGKTITYKGLRSSWYKRRMGMIHAPEAIIGEYATVSDWFSELLMRCLQWPGFESSFVKNEDIQRIQDLVSFRKCIESRIEKLNGLICRSSELPAIPTEVRRPNKFDKNFRIVTVQQILPKTSDFSASDVELNNPRIRAKHRAHLASICSLTLKTLEAKRIADGEDKKPSADLIVFPEVAVHIEDQDIIKRLADKTNSIIFAGLVFTDHNGKLVNIARWFIPDYQKSGRQWIVRDQGKQHMTQNEQLLGVTSYRPCQHILEVHGHTEGPFRITGAICYDATDINLAADLRDKTDLFVVAAHNKDVTTFDNMASALQWHMYQHVVICNIGEFGGSTIQAPYKQQYDKLISHVHGVGQISINTADIDLAAFRRKKKEYKEVKAKPAGVK
ncbi:reverse transcriptase domain-containing protein [Pleionea mediterranea]|uniref:Reverse transcriptase (RNA-dependent DNA polymerase) n=1 Tax=Pleionea mediterranea TaxID=523701 RepID=A0A316FD97_9GAMM|nr:reverse transcriptase domain-containing protein [Pleionea mediterranea]PWK46854.1 reverse transcriptase (RNA-dependent DNA polymerase) [Pleionea mediterranea]